MTTEIMKITSLITLGRVEKHGLIVTGILVAINAIVGSSELALGAGVGGGLVLVNFLAIRLVVGALIGGAHSKGFSVFVLMINFLLDLITSMMGSREKAKRYFPLLGTSFMFILISNLLGLIPGFLSPTGNFNTTVACALVIFVMYNFYGFKENGVAYLKHFAGPIIYIAPLMIVIEIISHLVRPLSLSLRLFWNMTGDHLVLGIFTNLTHFVVPALFIALGIFISFLQAFIFSVF